MRSNILVLGISTIVGSVVFSEFSPAYAGGPATVVVLRGKAKTGDGKALAEKQKVVPGTSVITEAGSFVRLLFADNTQLNVGPNTTMKIEASKPGEASLVDLVGGQIRAKVAKDLLKKDGGPVKEKMVIKTKTAAMGIRGTDFNVSFNMANSVTALVTFEGAVAMAKLDPGMGNPMAALQSSSGVQTVGAGQFSGANPEQAQASIPVKISPAQLESMKGNDTFEAGKAEKREAGASPVPPGIDPKNFSSGSDKAIGEAMSKLAGEENVKAAAKEANKDGAGQSSAPPEGFINKATGEYAPRAGGFIDLASGIYVPPPPGSAFDPNTGVFTPPSAMGAFDPATGAYVPPAGVDLDPVKGFVAEAPADGTRAPAGADVLALVSAMNTATDPNLAGVTSTMDTTFAPTGSTDGFVPPTLPPPESSLPPSPDAEKVTDGPEDSDSCVGLCNPPSEPIKTDTQVDFSITVN